MLLRVEDRDQRLVAISSDGRAPTSDIDDGNLNYDRGIVANVVRGTADLTLQWRWFGAYVRGYGFYDFENELGDTERTSIRDSGERDVSAGAALLDHYLSARFDVLGIPIQLRAGDQVLNWGESTFLRNSVDVINPLDFNQLLQPGAQPRDAFRPLGMVWGVATLTELVSVEAFYQYEWKDVKAPPVGSFYSVNDAFGSDGPNYLMLGAGRFSDLGTDLDEAFGLTPGTLGFDRQFQQLPGLGRDPARNGQQGGVTLAVLIPEWNATKFAWHYIHYHSRLPIIEGRTADQAAIDATSQQAVDARAAVLEGLGLQPAEAQAAAEALTVSEYANAAGYELVYPEGIDMIGTSFNTAIPRTGTLIAGEGTHRFDAPIQRGLGAVVGETLSPIQFTGGSATLGAEQRVKGFDRSHKTQATVNLTQLLGPRLGASQTSLAFDVAASWVHDPPDHTPNASKISWGYRIAGSMTYDNLLGGVSMSPFVLFTHDVDGNTPGPAGAFLEKRKSFTTGLSFLYLNAWTAEVSYTGFYDAGSRNRSIDRDSVRFSVGYSF